MISNWMQKNKTAVITGAAGGIGLETAKRLAAKGMNCVIVDLKENLEEAKETLLDIPSAGKIVAKKIDVTDKEWLIYDAKVFFKNEYKFQQELKLKTNFNYKKFVVLMDFKHGKKILKIQLDLIFFFNILQIFDLIQYQEPFFKRKVKKIDLSHVLYLLKICPTSYLNTSF